MSRKQEATTPFKVFLLMSAAGVGLTLMPHSARAQIVEQLLQPDRKTLLGDWGGARTNLKNDGFTFSLSYGGQMGYNFSGGKRQGADLANQILAGVDVDLGKVAGVEGGTLRITFTQRFGRSTSADYIGNEIPSQYMTLGTENLRLANFSYLQTYLNKRVLTEVGYFSMGNTFGADPLFCNFMTNAFCGHLVAQAHDSNGWSNFPLARWGGRVNVNVTPNFYIETGIFDSNPTNATYPNGLKVSFSGSTGVLIPVELGLTTSFFGLPGHYKIGAYYDTSQVADVVNTKEMDTGREGVYALFDQTVWSFTPDHSRGAAIFAGYTITDKTTNVVPEAFIAGVSIQGPFASRPKDFINFGYSRIWVNHRLIDARDALLAKEGDADFSLDNGETDIEAGYGFYPRQWLLLHPNIQYIGDPGAFSFTHTPNAWVFGFETRVVF